MRERMITIPQSNKISFVFLINQSSEEWLSIG